MCDESAAKKWTGLELNEALAQYFIDYKFFMRTFFPLSSARTRMKEDIDMVNAGMTIERMRNEYKDDKMKTGKEFDDFKMKLSSLDYDLDQLENKLMPRLYACDNDLKRSCIAVRIELISIAAKMRKAMTAINQYKEKIEKERKLNVAMQGYLGDCKGYEFEVYKNEINHLTDMTINFSFKIFKLNAGIERSLVVDSKQINPSLFSDIWSAKDAANAFYAGMEASKGDK